MNETTSQLSWQTDAPRSNATPINNPKEHNNDTMVPHA